MRLAPPLAARMPRNFNDAFNLELVRQDYRLALGVGGKEMNSVLAQAFAAFYFTPFAYGLAEASHMSSGVVLSALGILGFLLYAALHQIP